LHILREKKNDLVRKWKEEELRLQKQRVEVEGKREDQSRKQLQDRMKILLEQTKQQQEQMQSFQLMFTSIQQLQSQIIMKLLEEKITRLDLYGTGHNIFDFVVNTCFSI